jgi:hypothetical protein
MIKEMEEQIEDFRNTVEANRKLLKEYENREELGKNSLLEKEKDKEHQRVKK